MEAKNKCKFPNRIRNFLAGRSIETVANQLEISRQMMNNYASGARMPPRLRVREILRVLGEPWGRTLERSEVWPELLEDGAKINDF